jgi:hypothetical protein
MEYWNDGMMVMKKHGQGSFSTLLLPIIPPFHYSRLMA